MHTLTITLTPKALDDVPLLELVRFLSKYELQLMRQANTLVIKRKEENHA